MPGFEASPETKAERKNILLHTPLMALAIAAFGIGTSEFIIMGLLPNLADDFHVSFQPEVDLAGVARAAGAAHGVTVSDPGELPQVLKDALAVVHGGRSAVVSVHLPAV